MTRPRAAAAQFVDDMPPSLQAQVTPIFSPLLEIVPVAHVPDINAKATALFTSRNGVLHGPDGNGRAAYCVGDRTTAAATDRGWQAHMAGPDADALVTEVAATAQDQILVHLRGRHTRGDVAARLQAAGCDVSERVVYDQTLKTLTQEAQDALAGNTNTIVPLFSPRTAQQFAKVASRTTCTCVLALSQAVADAAAPFAVHAVCARPDADAMYDAMANAIASG